LLAVKYPKHRPALIVVNNWQAAIAELFSQDAVIVAVALKTIKSSYAESIVKVLEEKIKAALAADKCNSVCHKFNPSPTNAIKLSTARLH
jgi:hypothetical protein